MEKSSGKKNTAVLISGRGSNLRSLIKYSKTKKSLIKIVLVVSDNLFAKGLNYANKSNINNAELRKYSEEEKIIKPAIKELNRFKLDISGPFPSDTVFMEKYKNYDVIVGMYHDQVLAPFKSIFKYEAINITLGLKYLRVSPDHGTAKNLLGKKKANSTSLLNCINFINLHGK